MTLLGKGIRLIFTNVFTLLQGASSSTPAAAGSSHLRYSLPPTSKMTSNSTDGARHNHSQGSSLLKTLAAAPKRRAWSFSFVEKLGGQRCMVHLL